MMRPAMWQGSVHNFLWEEKRAGWTSEEKNKKSSWITGKKSSPTISQQRANLGRSGAKTMRTLPLFESGPKTELKN